MTEGLTQWLERLDSGDPEALDRVVRLLYDELRGLARDRLRNERVGHTLSPTALVNEAYLRLARQHRIPAGSRAQFFGVAAKTMRRVLVDYARTRKRLKRGGDQVAVPLEDVEAFLSDEEADEILTKAIHHPTANAFNVHQYGRQLLTEGRKERALEVFQANAARFPDTWPVDVGLARAYSALGQYEKALEHARLAYERAPNQLNKDALADSIKKLEKGEDIN